MRSTHALHLSLPPQPTALPNLFYSPAVACCALLLILGCSANSKAPLTSEAQKTQPGSAAPSTPQTPSYQVDPATAGSVTGTVHFSGKRPARKLIDMSEDPACVAAHHGKPFDESLAVAPSGALGNAFVYIKQGLEGKSFAPPATPVALDQGGCWFRPRILGIQTNQTLTVTNSDPVTHNIHPMAQVNREWNHSQGPGDPPLARKFLKPEVMIRVKCNIHSWMHAFIGVLDHPYFAVSKDDGTFEIKNLPPGTYTLAVWHETLGTQEQQITVSAHANAVSSFNFKATQPNAK